MTNTGSKPASHAPPDATNRPTNYSYFTPFSRHALALLQRATIELSRCKRPPGMIPDDLCHVLRTSSDCTSHGGEEIRHADYNRLPADKPSPHVVT